MDGNRTEGITEPASWSVVSPTVALLLLSASLVAEGVRIEDSSKLNSDTAVPTTSLASTSTSTSPSSSPPDVEDELRPPGLDDRSDPDRKSKSTSKSIEDNPFCNARLILCTPSRKLSDDVNAGA